MHSSNGSLLSTTYVAMSTTHAKGKIYGIQIYHCCIHTNKNGWYFSNQNNLNVFDTCLRRLQINKASQDFNVNYQECTQIESLLAKDKNSNSNNDSVFIKTDGNVFVCETHPYSGICNYSKDNEKVGQRNIMHEKNEK